MYLLEVLCAMLRYHFSMYVALLFMRREVVMLWLLFYVTSVTNDVLYLMQ